MLTSMSDERRDADAAAKAYLASLKEVDKAKKAELTKLFLNGFLKKYREVKSLGPKNLLSFFSGADSHVSLQTSSHPYSQADKSLSLGRGLGYFLSALELIALEPSLPSRSEILRNTSQIAYVLKQYCHMELIFIQQKIKRIVRIHAGKLTDEQKELLVAIAAQFSS